MRDLYKDIKKAQKQLIKANAGKKNWMFYYLPDENGRMIRHGPATPEEAYRKIKEYWDKTGGKPDCGPADGGK